jgi:hypothetical protein
VTVSLDGVEEVHDRLRPFLDGRGSYRRVIKNVEPLLSTQSSGVQALPGRPRLWSAARVFCMREAGADVLVRFAFDNSFSRDAFFLE